MRLAFKVDDSVAIEHQTKGMPKPMQDFMKGYLDWLAKQTVSVLQDVIRRQVYTWKPLSKNYLEFKKNFGLDTRIWYASGQMLESIKYWYVKGDNSYYIGVHPRKKYRKYKKGGGYYKNEDLETIAITFPDDFSEGGIRDEYPSGILTIECNNGKQIETYLPGFTDVSGEGFETNSGRHFPGALYVGEDGSTYFDIELTKLAREAE